MADTSIAVKDAATSSNVPIDGFTQPGGDFRQAIVIGDKDAAQIALVSSDGELIVADRDVSVLGSITAADTATTTAVSTGSTSGGVAYSVNRMSGTPTAGSAVSLTVSGQSSFSIDVSGTFVGSLVIERQVHSTAAWTAISAYIAGQPIQTSTISSPLALHGNASAAASIRVRATSWTSGSASVVIRIGAGPGTVTVGSANRIGDYTNPGLGLKVNTDGSLSIRKPQSSTSAGTSVAIVAASTFTLLAANTGRLGATFYNASAFTINLFVGTGASATVYTLPIAAGAYYELPNDGCGYVGLVSAYAASGASGNIIVTELLA